MLQRHFSFLDQPRVSLQEALNLDKDHIELLGRLFTEVLSPIPIDAHQIFVKLNQGYSMGEALSIPPGVINLLYARAYKWLSVQRMDRAERLFRTLCILNPKQADYWVGYGLCLMARQAWEEASQHFQQASALRPSWPVPYFHHLDLSLRLSRWEEARKCLAGLEARQDSTLTAGMLTAIERFKMILAQHEPSQEQKNSKT